MDHTKTSQLDALRAAGWNIGPAITSLDQLPKLGVVVEAPMPGWVGIPHIHVGDFRWCDRCGKNSTAAVHFASELLPSALERWALGELEVTDV